MRKIQTTFTSSATVYGFAALLLWSMILAFMRDVAETYGAAAGAALVFTAATAMLAAKFGVVFPRRAHVVPFLVSGLFFVAYNILFALAVTLSVNNRQALEVGLINYLWPGFLIVLSIPVLKLRPRWYVYPGLLVSYAGIAWCVSDGEVNAAVFLTNLTVSPFPYLCAFIGAFCWGAYSLSVRSVGAGRSDLVFFLGVVAAFFWSMVYVSGSTVELSSTVPAIKVILVACSYAFSFFLWEKGVSGGNITLLAICAYFLPVAATLFASFWLSVFPHPAFWYGVLMVVGGSLICWAATKEGFAS